MEDFDYSEMSQNIYSTFYVDVNGRAFPDEQWTDFPFAILRTWSENLIANVINMKSSVFDLTFFDGPYSIECSNNQGQIAMRFVNNRHYRVVEFEHNISSNDLVRSVYKTSERLIWQIEQRQYGPVRDVEELKGLVKLIVNFLQ